MNVLFFKKFMHGMNRIQLRYTLRSVPHQCVDSAERLDRVVDDGRRRLRFGEIARCQCHLPRATVLMFIYQVLPYTHIILLQPGFDAALDDLRQRGLIAASERELDIAFLLTR